MKLIDIARICHTVNREYCAALGDMSQKPWEEASQEQRDSVFKGVGFHLTGDKSPQASHEAWMREKFANGWTYGPVKDEVAKTHPCMLPYEGLPIEQRVKDYLFRGVVLACSPYLEELGCSTNGTPEPPEPRGTPVNYPDKGPRITPADIEAVIKEVAYHRLSETLTVCVITLVNGFTATGESACVSPENFNEQIGRDIAYRNAVQKIWMLEGYVLATDIYRKHVEVSAVKQPSECAWLIEIVGPRGKPMYFSIDGAAKMAGWSETTDQALRFTREVDAVNFWEAHASMYAREDVLAKTAEHIFQ